MADEEVLKIWRQILDRLTQYDVRAMWERSEEFWNNCVDMVEKRPFYSEMGHQDPRPPQVLDMIFRLLRDSPDLNDHTLVPDEYLNASFRKDMREEKLAAWASDIARMHISKAYFHQYGPLGMAYARMVRQMPLEELQEKIKGFYLRVEDADLRANHV